MTPVTVTTHVESDTVTLPELRAFAGRTVAITIAEASDDPLEGFVDTEFHAQCEAEAAADPSPVLTIEEVQALLAGVRGKLSDAIIAEREER